MKRLLVIALLVSVSLGMGWAKDVKTVVCIGNSITKGSWLSHPERDSYPAALERMLGEGWKVENMAVSGSCVAQGCKNLYVSSDSYAKIKKMNPQVVAIYLGTDDARKPNQENLAKFAEGLTQMVRELKVLPSHPQVVLMTPAKVFSTAFNNDDAALKGKVVPAVKQVAQTEQVALADAYAASENDSRYYEDGVHPNAIGAGHIAEELYRAITGKKKAYVRPLSMPTLFTDHAVLQQQSDVALWGYGAANQKVTVKPSWTKAVTTTCDADGNWKVRIPTLAASYTKYSVEISQGKESIKMNDVLMGEVWLAAGQSNMQMEIGGFYRTAVKGGPEAIATSDNDMLRLYRVPRSDQQRATDDVKNNGWEVACPASVEHFSATGYFFARNLQKTLGIPVGIIQSAYGGASIVSFMSPEAIAQHQDVKGGPFTKEYKDMKAPGYGEKYDWPQHTPTVIYNMMIKPILTYNIKGAIWYQGCDDRRHPQLYKKFYATFLKDWREKWQCGDFPFYYAQIAPYGYGDNTCARMREAQEQLEDDQNKSYMICLMDNGWEKNIHPDDKPTVGFRFAQRVLDKTYQIKGINSTYPHYKSWEMREKDGKVVIRFTGADDGIAKIKEPSYKGFQIAGKDRQFYNVEAKDEGNTIVLTPPAGVKPVAIRYCFKDYCEGSVYNMRGNPLSSFRTDDWDD